MNNKKKIRILIILLLIIFFVVGCDRTSHTGLPNTLEDIAYDNTEKYGYTVYILENNEYIPYLVLTKDYYGDCLLIRKHCLDSPMRFNNYNTNTPSYYENSEVDKFLNDNYINCFSTEFKNLIANTKIEITDDSSIGKCGDKIKKIERKIFLLSLNEVGISTGRIFLAEGEDIKFFKNNEHRIASTRDGPSCQWHLRTPDTWDNEVTTSVNEDGIYDSEGILTIAGYTEKYVRPAFCLPRDTKIEQKNIDNYICYVIE